MSKISAVFDESKFSLDEAKCIAKKIDFVQQNSESYINEYFLNVIIDIDLRREVLKAKIDEYSDGLIKAVKETQQGCIKASKETNEITEKIEKSKAELDSFIKEIETYLDYKKTKEVDKKCQTLRQDLDCYLTDYKRLITRNTCFFNLSEIPVQDIFGELGNLPESVSLM
jgi:hypothetical protein